MLAKALLRSRLQSMHRLHPHVEMGVLLKAPRPAMDRT